MRITKVFIGVIFIVLLLVLSTVFSLYKMQLLSSITQKLYAHPFAVSNAIGEIRTNIITIHRNMKDIVLADSTKEIISLLEDIKEHELIVDQQFALIFERYLGDKADIQKSHKAFKDWKKIRDEVIDLRYQNRLKEATLITKGKGADHIRYLYEQMDILKDYASKKAETFYEDSIEQSGISDVIIIFLFVLIIGMVIGYYLIHGLFNIDKDHKRQLHLIDQNILTAKIALDGSIEGVSNALCRVMQVKKDQILQSKCHFFVEQEQYALFEQMIYSGKEWSGEVSRQIGDENLWFKMEIFPQLDSNYELKYFDLFLSNITDKKMIEEVSIHDTLTGLYNRNYFEMIFVKEVRRAKRDHKSLCMMMIDIDFFKQYNDTYGHQQGDKALKAVADVLFDSTNRSYDYAFRVGGEEFVILCYQDAIASAEKFAQNIVREVESLKIEHAASTISSSLTISAGVMLFNDNHHLSTDEMYRNVDELLYKAKANGRNRVEAFNVVS